jgi:predicted Zn-dependent protease
VHYATFAGYDPQGLVRYFERLGSMKGKNTVILDKTHPTCEERISRLKETIKEEELDGNSANLFPKRFAEMKALIQ